MTVHELVKILNEALDNGTISADDRLLIGRDDEWDYIRAFDEDGPRAGNELVVVNDSGVFVLAETERTA